MNRARGTQLEKVIAEVEDVKTSLEELQIEPSDRDDVLDDAIVTLDRVGDKLDEIHEEK